MSYGADCVRDTALGSCIGATILDITAIDSEEWEKFPFPDRNRVFLHLSNGETLYVTLGDEKLPDLVGMLGDEEEEPEPDAPQG